MSGIVGATGSDRVGVAVLGIDLGGVVIDRTSDRGRISFSGPNYLATTPVLNVFSALSRLNAGSFAGRIHLISRVHDQEMQEKTDHWLEHHRFFQRTGILKRPVHYCQERHEKARICRDLSVTHFVDDRLEILGGLIGLVPNLILFQPKVEEIEKFKMYYEGVQQAFHWLQVEEILNLSLSAT